MLHQRLILIYFYKSIIYTKNKGFWLCLGRLGQKNRDVLIVELSKHAACGEVIPPNPFIQANSEWQTQQSLVFPSSIGW
jgi:hypothetical protein